MMYVVYTSLVGLSLFSAVAAVDIPGGPSLGLINDGPSGGQGGVVEEIPDNGVNAKELKDMAVPTSSPYRNYAGRALLRVLPIITVVSLSFLFVVLACYRRISRGRKEAQGSTRRLAGKGTDACSGSESDDEKKGGGEKGEKSDEEGSPGSPGEPGEEAPSFGFGPRYTTGGRRASARSVGRHPKPKKPVPALSLPTRVQSDDKGLGDLSRSAYGGSTASLSSSRLALGGSTTSLTGGVSTLSLASADSTSTLMGSGDEGSAPDLPGLLQKRGTYGSTTSLTSVGASSGDPGFSKTKLDEPLEEDTEGAAAAADVSPGSSDDEGKDVKPKSRIFLKKRPKSGKKGKKGGDDSSTK